MGRVCFLNPNTIFLKSDPFTTGIVYMPIGLAYAVAVAKNRNIQFQVLDTFGLSPKQSRLSQDFVYLGLNPEETISRIQPDVELVIIYANQLTNTKSIVEIIEEIKSNLIDVKICIMENTQAVTSYNLEVVASDFFNLGVDGIIVGEIEESLEELVKHFDKKFEDNTRIQGLILKNDSEETKRSSSFISNLDKLPFPAWEEFPLENYWNLGYGHGPVHSNRYLPILTSRGCPYPCGFCVVPSTNLRKWRARSPENVVDEIEFFKKKFQVSEFHVEDLDPTINDTRTKNFCKLLIERNVGINWKIVAGTKVETIKNKETVELMAKSGCVYISISPESGSAEVLKKMNKPFDLIRALEVSKECIKNKIKIQACFVLGYPGETKSDLRKTGRLIRKLSIFGIDEIALFVISPVPGSSIYQDFDLQNVNLSQLNFSPTWREDFKKLNSIRLFLYIQFILIKAIFHPIKIIHNIYGFFTKKFQTKMEMTPFRALEYRRALKRCDTTSS
jgi:radical SAM superfamily enzyme YgiQ (UPF0313 family)